MHDVARWCRVGKTPSNNAYMREVTIRDDSIRLGQLLKLANLVGSGADVKGLLTSESIYVNDTLETRRGRQIHPGDLVRCGDESVQVARATEE